MITLRDTPIEIHKIRGIDVHVKREDLCWPFPPLSKARGVWAAIESRPGVNVAVVDTGKSLNGQLVATIGLQFGRKVLCGYPQYKNSPFEIPGPALAIKSLGVPLIPLQASMQFMMRHAMSEYLRENTEGEWFLFPTGLRLPETVGAVAAVVRGLPFEPGTIVVPTGTGTHLAGILRAFTGDVIAVQGYDRGEKRFRQDVGNMVLGNFLIAAYNARYRVIRSHLGYYEVRSERLPPFPANPSYEVKAWAWLNTPGVVESLTQPIVFWNIGA